MINPVPPNDTLVGKVEMAPKMYGKPATTAKKIEPTTVILINTLLTYFSVSSPGLTPGIYPPFFVIFRIVLLV